MKIHIAPSVISVLILASFTSSSALGADIFRSEGLDGTVSYTTQPLDKSYRVYLRDEEKKEQPKQAARGRVRAFVATNIGDTISGTISMLVDQLAEKHQVDPVLVKAVISVESAANPNAVSSKGASGLMQLMPATAAMYGVTKISDPAQNIEAGILHLKYLLRLHKGNLSLTLAAYNAGEGAVAKNAHRIPPYRETMLYVPAVLARMQLARDIASR